MKKVTLSTKIKDWYTDQFKDQPGEASFAESMNPDATFQGVLDCLKNEQDIYDYINVGDSVVRENIFKQLATILDKDYDYVYYLWLYGENGKKTESKEIKTESTIVYTYQVYIDGVQPVMYTDDTAVNDAKKEYIENEGIGHDISEVKVIYYDEPVVETFGESKEIKIESVNSDVFENIDTLQDLQDVVDNLYEEDKLDDDKYDEITTYVDERIDSVNKYIDARSKVTNTDEKDIVGIMEDNTLEAIEKVKKIMNESKQLKTEAAEENNTELQDELLDYMFTECDLCVNHNEGIINYIPDDLDNIQYYFDENTTQEDLAKVTKQFKDLIADAEFYLDRDDGKIYIQLSDNHTLFQINNDKIDMDTYSELLTPYFETFEEDTGVELLALGRSGRHICVEFNLDNLKRYDELKQEQRQLEQEFIEYVNSYKPYEDDEEDMEESKQIKEETKQEYTEYCDVNKEEKLTEDQDKLFSGVEFEKLIPYEMRFKEYNIIEDTLDLFWVTQQPFTIDDLKEFWEEFINTGLNTAYVTVRDFSTYEWNADMNRKVLAVVTKEGFNATDYMKKCQEAGWLDESDKDESTWVWIAKEDTLEESVQDDKLKEIIKNAKRQAKADGYDQYIYRDTDGDYSITRLQDDTRELVGKVEYQPKAHRTGTVKYIKAECATKELNEARLGNHTFTDADEAEYYRNKELYANSGLARHREAMEKAKEACKAKGIDVDETRGVYESVQVKQEPLHLKPFEGTIEDVQDVVDKFVKIGGNYYRVFKVTPDGAKFVISFASAGPAQPGGDFEPATLDEIKKLQLYVEEKDTIKESKKLKTEAVEEQIDVHTTPVVYMNTWKNYNQYGADLTLYNNQEGWMTIEQAKQFSKEHKEDSPFINDLDVDLPFNVDEYSSVDVALDEIEQYLSLYEDDRKIVDAIFEAQTNDYDEVMQIFKNNDYIYLPDVKNTQDLGYQYVQEMGLPTDAIMYFNTDEYKDNIWDHMYNEYLEQNNLDEMDDETAFDEWLNTIVEQDKEMFGSDQEVYKDDILNNFDYQSFGEDLENQGWTICSNEIAIYVS